MRGARELALLAAAGLAGGCGGSAARRPPGAAVFARDCTACHSLLGNESLHRQGGDLLGYRISRAELLEFTREMPVRHPLTRAELNDVVDYVFALQRHARSR
jgi:mono/diheme cytochrome c family protein